MNPKDWADIADEIVWAMRNNASPIFMFGLILLMKSYPVETLTAMQRAIALYMEGKNKNGASK